MSLAGGGWLAFRDYDFAARSTIAEAEVLDKSWSMSDKGTSSIYQLHYGFKTPQGQAVEGRGMVSWSVYENAKAGDRLAVQYLPEAPQSNRVETSPNYSVARIFGGIGFVLLAIGVPCLVKGVNQARRSHASTESPPVEGGR